MATLPPLLEGVTVGDLPGGYVYRATRYADLILRDAFPKQYSNLVAVLSDYYIELAELQVGGGNRTPFVARFDDGLKGRGWGKKNIDIETAIDGETIAKVRSHEIDMFAFGSEQRPYPGVAVEMEWNNKDPFFDRDLTNFYALHRAGALAVGVVVTRGPQLQRIIKPTVRNKEKREKFGESTTHWTKLMPRIDLGGGGECPLLLVGIQPERITRIDLLYEVAARIEQAELDLKSYKELGITYKEALETRRQAILDSLDLLPPVSGELEDEGQLSDK